MLFSTKIIFYFAAISSALLAMAGTPVIERQCLQTYQKECVTFFNGKEVAPSESLQYSIFPNARNLSLVDTLTEFNDFYLPLSLNNYCSYLLHSFLCIHYFSPCDPESNSKVFVVPCRAVCEEAAVECRLDSNGLCVRSLREHPAPAAFELCQFPSGIFRQRRRRHCSLSKPRYNYLCIILLL